MHCVLNVLLLLSVFCWHTFPALPVKCRGPFKNGECGLDQYCGTETKRCEDCANVCFLSYPDDTCPCPNYGKSPSPPPSTSATTSTTSTTTKNPTKAPMEKNVTANTGDTGASKENRKAPTPLQRADLLSVIATCILAVGGLCIIAFVGYGFRKLKRNSQTTHSEDSTSTSATETEVDPLMDQSTGNEALKRSSGSDEVVAMSRSSEQINQHFTNTHTDSTCQDPTRPVRPTSPTSTPSTSADFIDASRNAVTTPAQIHSDEHGLHTNAEEIEMDVIDPDVTLVKKRYPSDDTSLSSSNPPSNHSTSTKVAGISDCTVLMHILPRTATPVNPATDVELAGRSATNSPEIASTSTSVPCSAPMISRNDSGVSTTSENLGATARKSSEASTSSSTTGTPPRKDSGVPTTSSAPGATPHKDSGASTNSSPTGMHARKDSDTSTASSAPGTMSRKDSGVGFVGLLTTSSSSSLDSAVSMPGPDPEPEPEAGHLRSGSVLTQETLLIHPVTLSGIPCYETNNHANHIRAIRDVP